MKLHCNDCGNSYDSILSEDEIDIAVCPRCGSFGSSVPAVADVKETPEEALTPPRESAPVAESLPVENRPEASSRAHEGHSSTPLSETRSDRILRGRFFSRVPRKGLFIAAGILVLLLIVAVGVTWTIVTKGPEASGGDVDVVIERETPAPTPAKEEEKQAEQQAPQTPPEKPAQAPAPKVVKKASSPAPKASTSNTPNTPWKYRVESPAPAPKQAPPPRAQAQKSGIAGWLDKTLGPEVPVTPPPAAGDARGTGM